MVDKNGKKVVVGVVSLGNGHECTTSQPRAFARVNELLDFIEENTGVSSDDVDDNE